MTFSCEPYILQTTQSSENVETAILKINQFMEKSFDFHPLCASTKKYLPVFAMCQAQLWEAFSVASRRSALMGQRALNFYIIIDISSCASCSCVYVSTAYLMTVIAIISALIKIYVHPSPSTV